MGPRNGSPSLCSPGVLSPYVWLLSRALAVSWSRAYSSGNFLLFRQGNKVKSILTFSILLLSRASESGYIPGILFLLTRIYKPQELGFRVSILICTGALSGMASGPIAYAASMMPATYQRPWQYLFIMEGAPTVVLALISYWLLFDDLDEVRWLSNDLKAVQRARMAPFQSLNAHTSVKAGLRGALVDWKTWMFSLIHLLTSINITSLSVFAPFLIHGLGFPVLQAQLLTAPPCVVAAIAMLVCGVLADKLFHKRALIVGIGSLLIAFGYCLLLAFPPALIWGMFIGEK